MLTPLRLSTFVLFSLSLCAFAQQGPVAGSAETVAPFPANRLVAPVDSALTIKTVTVLPVQDNVNSIFSRPVETKLVDLVKATHRFEYQEPKNFDGSTDEFEQSPEKVKAAAHQMGVDAFFTAKVFKTPKKTEITLMLYLATDGFPLTREDKSFDGKVEVRTLEKGATDLFAKAVDRIPYKGMILSRQGNRVTIDLGVTDGVKANQVLSVDQILGVSRHPKFKFILSTEKETIGKIRVLKVDDTLSFGAIIQEKDRGVITKDAKIAPTEFVTYDDSPMNAIGPMGTMEPQQPNNAVSFGKNPREWLPENAPTFGRLQMGLGIGSMQRTNSASISGTKEARAPLYPSVEIKGELWITTHWYVGAGTDQGIMSIDNPNPGNPATLSATLTSYEFRGGYRFLLQDDFFGPQVSLHGGLQKHSMFIDAANPVIFTSTSYSGFFLGVAGSLPITNDRRWYLDVELNRFFYPALTETPVTSAATADLSITQFSFGTAYRLTNRFFLTGRLDLGFYSATFNGAGTRTGADPSTGSTVPDSGLNMSERTTQLVGGLSYLF